MCLIDLKKTKIKIYVLRGSIKGALVQTPVKLLLPS